MYIIRKQSSLAHPFAKKMSKAKISEPEKGDQATHAEQGTQELLDTC